VAREGKKGMDVSKRKNVERLSIAILLLSRRARKRQRREALGFEPARDDKTLRADENASTRGERSGALSRASTKKGNGCVRERARKKKLELKTLFFNSPSSSLLSLVLRYEGHDEEEERQ
jgi:hypothetical protein